MHKTSRFNLASVQKSFGNAAENYDRHAILQHEIREECIALAAECWGENARILDLGCGTGMFQKYACAKGLSWDIAALDLAFGMCKTARAHSPLVVNGQGEYLPFKDGVFDGVFSCLMLQWASDPAALFKEIWRTLKPGGRAILSSFIHGTLAELKDAFAGMDSARHVNDFGTPNYFSALAVHAGFRQLLSEEHTITHYYPDIISLMRGLKSIGASTKEQGELRTGLMTPRQLERLENAYRERFLHKKGLPASWQVMIMMVEKPA